MLQVSNDVVQSFLEFIVNQKNDASVKSYIAIKNALNVFIIPFPMVTLPKGKRLFRCRINEENENYFSKFKDLSNRTDINNITEFGRANEPLQSIFYCSDNAHVARFETSKIVRQNSNKELETITTGIWEVQEDLRVAHIISNHTIKGLNKTVDGLQTNFEELIEELRNEKTDNHLKVLDLFSQEFTRDVHGNPNNYLISCAFANYIFDNYGFDTYHKKDTQSSGIIYPSVILRTEGVNLALKSEIVETDKIKLVGAVKIKMRKVNDKEYRDGEVIQAKSIDPNTGEISW